MRALHALSTADPDWRRLRSVAFLIAALLLGCWAGYDAFLHDGYTLGTWLAAPMDWLFLLSLLIVVCFGVVPLAVERERTRKQWARFRQYPGAVAGLVYLVAFFLLGTVGQLAVGSPSLDFLHPNQPPVFATVDADLVPACLGRVADGRCHGTMRYPLGTDLNGYGMGKLLLAGMRVSVYVGFVAGTLVVPVAVLVGTVAGYAGGRVDLLLMRYVEIQDTVPAIVVYLLVIILWGESLLLVVVLFGFLSWGVAARVVRSETQTVAASEFVTAARTLGGSPRYVYRKHVLPNVTASVVPTATQQIPALLLAEASVAFLGLESFDLQSFGNVIARGVYEGDVPMLVKWWVWGFAALALALAVLSLKFVGDALVDVVDPRER